MSYYSASGSPSSRSPAYRISSASAIACVPLQLSSTINFNVAFEIFGFFFLWLVMTSLGVRMFQLLGQCTRSITSSNVIFDYAVGFRNIVAEAELSSVLHEHMLCNWSHATTATSHSCSTQRRISDAASACTGIHSLLTLGHQWQQRMQYRSRISYRRLFEPNLTDSMIDEHIIHM